MGEGALDTPCKGSSDHDQGNVLRENKSQNLSSPNLQDNKIIHNSFFDNIDLSPWESEQNGGNLNMLLGICDNSPEKKRSANSSDIVNLKTLDCQLKKYKQQQKENVNCHAPVSEMVSKKQLRAKSCQGRARRLETSTVGIPFPASTAAQDARQIAGTKELAASKYAMCQAQEINDIDSFKKILKKQLQSCYNVKPVKKLRKNNYIKIKRNQTSAKSQNRLPLHTSAQLNTETNITQISEFQID